MCSSFFIFAICLSCFCFTDPSQFVVLQLHCQTHQLNRKSLQVQIWRTHLHQCMQCFAFNILCTCTWGHRATAAKQAHMYLISVETVRTYDKHANSIGLWYKHLNWCINIESNVCGTFSKVRLSNINVVACGVQMMSWPQLIYVVHGARCKSKVHSQCRNRFINE